MRRGDTALYQITLTTCFTNCNNSQTYLTRLPRKINICDGYLSKIYVGKQKKNYRRSRIEIRPSYRPPDRVTIKIYRLLNLVNPNTNPDLDLDL